VQEWPPAYEVSGANVCPYWLSGDAGPHSTQFCNGVYGRTDAECGSESKPVYRLGYPDSKTEDGYTPTLVWEANSDVTPKWIITNTGGCDGTSPGAQIRSCSAVSSTGRSSNDVCYSPGCASPDDQECAGAWWELASDGSTTTWKHNGDVTVTALDSNPCADLAARVDIPGLHTWVPLMPLLAVELIAIIVSFCLTGCGCCGAASPCFCLTCCKACTTGCCAYGCKHAETDTAAAVRLLERSLVLGIAELVLGIILAVLWIGVFVPNDAQCGFHTGSAELTFIFPLLGIFHTARALLMRQRKKDAAGQQVSSAVAAQYESGTLIPPPAATGGGGTAEQQGMNKSTEVEPLVPGKAEPEPGAEPASEPEPEPEPQPEPEPKVDAA
jgi:hypothetical protein